MSEGRLAWRDAKRADHELTKSAQKPSKILVCQPTQFDGLCQFFGFAIRMNSTSAASMHRPLMGRLAEFWTGMEILSCRRSVRVLLRHAARRRSENMITLKRFMTSTAIAVALTLPSMAFAQDTLYVVQDVKTKKCTIVDKKPVTTEYTTVGSDGVIYKTRTEAEAAMKTVKVCTTQ